MSVSYSSAESSPHCILSRRVLNDSARLEIVLSLVVYMGSIAMSSCFHVHPYRPMLITLHIRRLRFHMPWLCVCVCFLFVCLFWNTGAIATTKDVCVFFSHVYLLFFTVLPSARRVNQSSNVAKIQPCSKSLLLIQNDLAKNFGQL